MKLTNEQKVKATVELLEEEIKICYANDAEDSDLFKALILVRNYIQDCNEDYFEN